MVSPHSNGKFYDLHDLVKAGSSDCKGCSACCENMGDSIRLDPYDLYQLKIATGMEFEALIGQYIELSMQDGLIRVNLKMLEHTNSCAFLKDHRCSIHKNRPGLCRLFPLGRNYEDGKMNYLLLQDTCGRTMTKVKVSNWIGLPEIEKYHNFVIDWHYFQKDCQSVLATMADKESAKKINLFLLFQFFQKPYDLSRDFYEQFYERLTYIQSALEK